MERDFANSLRCFKPSKTFCKLAEGGGFAGGHISIISLYDIGGEDIAADGVGRVAEPGSALAADKGVVLRLLAAAAPPLLLATGGMMHTK